MQFLIIARDQADAAERRKQFRPEHIANLRRVKATGNFILGGALLDGDGEMCGSAMIVDFNDRATLDAWLKDEPFIREKVWGQIEIHPYRVAPV